MENTARIAKIATAIRETIDAGGETCATFEVVGRDELWLQFTGNAVNAAYPHGDDPKRNAAVKPLLEEPSPKPTGWEADTFATFEFDGPNVDVIARWIDRYFVLVLGCRAEFYDVKVDVGDLGGADLDGDSSLIRS